jgi:hypothetical protein
MKLRFFLKKWHDHFFVNVVPNQKHGSIVEPNPKKKFQVDPANRS